MSRKPSPETELRAVRAEFSRFQATYDERIRECTAFRLRAIKAEEECAEWKRRFDLLLERTPKEPTT